MDENSSTPRMTVCHILPRVSPSCQRANIRPSEWSSHRSQRHVLRPIRAPIFAKGRSFHHHPPVWCSHYSTVLKTPWVIEGLLATLEQVMPAVGHPQRRPSTSNAAEWCFRDDERLVYLPKGPFQDQESAMQ